MKSKWKKRISRIVGTWGISFFGPLVAGNVAETMYNLGLDLEMYIMIALVASLFQLGLSLSQEARDFGQSV